jgi:hypothetical protein
MDAFFYKPVLRSIESASVENIPPTSDAKQQAYDTKVLLYKYILLLLSFHVH